jgi:hypothetical protein
MRSSGERAALASDPHARPCQCLGQALGAERFQQVVDRMDLERFDRVLVIGGDEDDRDLAPEQLQHVKAVQLRHLNVEEDQIRLLLRDRFHRLETVAALCDDVDVRVRCEQLAQQHPRQRFIVNNDHPQWHFRARRHTVARVTTGIRTSTRNRPSSSRA